MDNAALSWQSNEAACIDKLRLPTAPQSTLGQSGPAPVSLDALEYPNYMSTPRKPAVHP